MAQTRIQNHTGTFYFVNKDASNVRRKDQGESHTIACHVQKEHYKRKRESRMRQLQVISFKQEEVPAQRTVTVRNKGPLLQVTKLGDLLHIDDDDPRKVTPTAKKPPSTSRFAQSKSSPSSTNKLLTPLPSPLTILNAGNTDPFSASALPIDPCTVHLTAIATTYHFALTWPLERYLGTSSPALTAWYAIITSSLSDAGRMASFLGYAAALKAQVNPLLDPGEREHVRTSTLQYKTIAIRGLRKKMEGEAVSLGVLRIVLNLMCLEAYAYNLEAARMHFRAAREVVRGLGGMKCVPWLVKEYIAVADTNMLMIGVEVGGGSWHGGQSFFGVDEWDPGSLAESEVEICGGFSVGLGNMVRKRLEEERRKTGGEFSDVMGLCGDRVAGLVDALREVVVTEELIREETGKSEEADKYWDVHRWAQLRITACRYRLNVFYRDVVGPFVEELRNVGLHHCVSSGGVDGGGLRQRQQLRTACACIGAKFCHILVFYQTSVKLGRWGTFGQWEEALELCSWMLLEQKDVQTTSARDDRERRHELCLLLWVACMVSMVHILHCRPQHAEVGCVRELIPRLMGELGLKTLEEVKETCAKVLWCDRIMGEKLRIVIEGAV